MKKRFLPGDLVYKPAEGASQYALWAETGQTDGFSQETGYIENGTICVVVATWYKRGQSELLVLCPTGVGWQVDDVFRKAGAP